MLPALDRPIASLWGRTAREVLLILGGVAVAVWSLCQPQLNLWHTSFYIGATIAFAVRFYAARVVAVGFIATALALTGINATQGEPLFWGALALLPGLALLVSSDLRERFDRAPRANPWRSIDRRHWVAWCGVGYLLGVLGNLYLLPWRSIFQAGGNWPLVILGAVYLAVGLLFCGRAIAFVVAAAAGLAGLITALAEPQLLAARPGFDWAAIITGAAITAIAAPYAALALRANGRKPKAES